MRGYLTFLVVFAACLLLVSLFQFNANAKYSNSASAIWIERYNQAEMNIKEAIVEAVREGAVEGVYEYAKAYVDSGCPGRLAEGDLSAVPNMDCIEYYVNKKSVEKIKGLDGRETDGMKFLISIDPIYELNEAEDVCERMPCGSTPQITQKLVVEMFGFDVNKNLPQKEATGISDSDALLNGVTLRIKKDEMTQRTPITITVRHDGFDDVVFNMPEVEIKGD